MQGIRYAVGVAAVYAFVMLLVCLVSGCGCICYDVVSPKNIGDIARSNTTNMYGKYSVRVEDVPYVMDEEEFKKVMESRIGSGKGMPLSISITDEERANAWGRAVGGIGFITWLIIPVWNPSTHVYLIEISGEKFRKQCKLEVKETKYISILPWSFLPVLWHQNWICDSADKYYRVGKLGRQELELMADVIIAQLDEGFYMLGKYGLEEYERIRREQRSFAEAFARQQQAENVQKQKETEALQELRLREFALAQAPALWETYQSFKDEIGGLDTRMEILKSDLIDFGRDPEKDPDYKSIVSMRAEMGETLKSLRNRLVDAYFAFCKFRATPGVKRNEEIFENVRQEGLQEAGAAKARFDEMRKVK